MTAHAVALALHIGGGIGAVVVGLVAVFLPKFGRRSVIHCRIGQLYLLLLGTSAAVGIPLAAARENTYLVFVGAVTLFTLAVGWGTIRLSRRALRLGHRARADGLLRAHVGWMGGSYIGAWSGFFANNFVFGTGDWAATFYAIGPTVIGAVVLNVVVPRVKWPAVTSPPNRAPPAR